MKKKLLILTLGLLLIGVNVYAAGDLQVNGLLGVGAGAGGGKVSVLTTNTRGMKVTATMDQDGLVSGDNVHGMTLKSDVTGSASGFGSGINLISNIGSTATTVGSAFGGSFIVSLSSSSSGSTTVSETATGKFETLINPGNHNYNVTQGYGFDLSLRDNRNSGVGALHFNDFKHVSIRNAANAYGALSVDNLTGVMIEKQTLGGTSNYGIVLNGEGAGADLAFGLYSGTRPRIFTQSGEIKVQDSAGNISQISPHDPKTGEWIFYSKNVKTGRVVEVNMEKLVKAVEKLTGETFMVETLIQE